MNSLLIIGVIFFTIAVVALLALAWAKFVEWYCGVVRGAEERGWREHEYMFPPVNEYKHDNEPIY